MNPTYAVISGPICAGKDELIQTLRKRNVLQSFLLDGQQIFFLNEAVNHDGEVLNGYYQNQRSTAEFFDLGTLCFRTVLTSTIPSKNGIVIGNRHQLEARASFIEYGAKARLIDAASIGIHDTILRRGIEKNLIPIPDIVFYLDVADPEILIKRNKKRCATGEEHLAEQYLRDLSPYFNRYKENFHHIYNQFGVPVPELVVLDSSPDYSEDPLILEKLAEICEEKILNLHRSLK